MVLEEGAPVLLLQKYNFEPTGKNIQLIQFVCLCGLLYALIAPVSWHWYLLALVVYCMNVLIGVSFTLHRMYSHKCFTTTKPLQKILSLHACLSMLGSPLSYAYIHRFHHSNSDTEIDPHSPKHGILHSIFGLHEPKRVHTFIIRDFLKDKFQMFIHNYYTLIIFLLCIMVSVFSVNLLVFGLLIPGFFASLASRVNNWVTHDTRFGVQDNDSEDNSRNVWWWNLLTFGSGEGWANNHHHQAGNYDFGYPQNRIDTVARLIDILQRMKIVEVRS